MDKENVAHTHRTCHAHTQTDIYIYIIEYYSTIEENEIIEIIILSEVRQISYITYIQNLKKMIQIVTKKLIYKIETDSDFEKDYGYQRGKGG